MDETDPEIAFDENGICNHCKNYETTAKIILKSKDVLENIFEKIKETQKHKKYDCILGISGGTDSSYVAYMAYKYGLRTLLIHFDNGWDTPESQHNIKAIVNGSGFDFQNITCNADELRDLQLGYLKSGVINMEVISDHAIQATVYNTAVKNHIKNILSGTNWATEGILPKAWGYRHNDLRNIKDIHKHHGTIPLRTFPELGLMKLAYCEIFKRMRKISPLNYIKYDKQEAKETLIKEWGWQDYGIKHGENILTRFYQQYILPKRTGYDKRKAHYSALICSGQMTREEALEKLKKPIYENPEMLEMDKAFFLKKMGLTEEELHYYISLPAKEHDEYKTDTWLYNLLKFTVRVKGKLAGRFK